MSRHSSPFSPYCWLLTLILRKQNTCYLLQLVCLCLWLPLCISHTYVIRLKFVSCWQVRFFQCQICKLHFKCMAWIVFKISRKQKIVGIFTPYPFLILLILLRLMVEWHLSHQVLSKRRGIWMAWHTIVLLTYIDHHFNTYLQFSHLHHPSHVLENIQWVSKRGFMLWENTLFRVWVYIMKSLKD